MNNDSPAVEAEAVLLPELSDPPAVEAETVSLPDLSAGEAATAADRSEAYKRQAKARAAHRRLLAEQGKAPRRWG